MEEIQTKHQRLADYCDRHGLDGVLLTRRHHFAWATAGCDNRIPDNSDTGVASILMTPDEQICLCNQIEGPRMATEELVARGTRVIEFPWYDDAAARNAIGEVVAGRKIAADLDLAGFGFAPLPAGFNELRFGLTPAEIGRFTDGAQLTTDALEASARAAEPGMTEYDLAANTAAECYRRGVVPVVNLIATDERVEKYRHPIPTGKKLQRYAMLVVCGWYGGLISNLTRFVHIGEPSAQLLARRQRVVNMDAAVNGATRPGRPMNAIFAELQAAYAQQGFEGEWKFHHQGGMAGYLGREVFGSPETRTLVPADSAWAWNPSVPGFKSEDTFLCRADGGYECLTKCGAGWPQITGESDHGPLPRADILVK